MKPPVHYLGLALLLLVVLAAAELLASITTRYVARTRGLYFYRPHLTESYEAYQARVHPLLGWPSPEVADKQADFYDASGARRSPAFPDPNQSPACVSLYGDSFIEAFGVDHEEAWGNVLSRLLHCRVANYGVAGYGTDQAFLRYQSNSADRARVVILGFLAENLQRNVNQFRNFLGPSPQCQIKPRFVLNDQGQLTLVPVPGLSKEDYLQLPQDPGRFFPYDFFVPGGPAGSQFSRFPHLWHFLRAAPPYLRKVFYGIHPYMEMYRPGHPSRALEVTVAIMAAFSQTARERGQEPLVLILPNIADVFRQLRHREWVYQPILSLLQEKQVAYLDAGPDIMAYLNGADPKTIYDPRIQHHFNAAGNRLLAQVVYRYLKARRLP